MTTGARYCSDPIEIENSHASPPHPPKASRTLRLPITSSVLVGAAALSRSEVARGSGLRNVWDGQRMPCQGDRSCCYGWPTLA